MTENSFWDWSLDSEDLSAAPVWSPSDGFGGDGHGTCDKAFLRGCCVTDGPFANLQVAPGGVHCLTRGFEGDVEKRIELSRKARPSAIAHILNAQDYEDFNLRLEAGLHAVIPEFVGGDFALFWAPFGKFMTSR